MIKPQHTLAALLALCASPAFAQTTATIPEHDWTLAANVGVVSDYRFRGISQTNKNPAIQGGFDFAIRQGFYAGNWNSNIDSAQFNGANVEMDFYAGYKAAFGNFGLDGGGIYYEYPGTGAGGSTKIKNAELYIGGSWGPVAVRYYYAVTDFNSAPNSTGSWYVNASASHELRRGFGLNWAVGYQGLKGGAALAEINGDTPGSIVDYKLGGTYTIKGFAFGLAYIATNRDYAGRTDAAENISDGTALLSVSKTF